MGALGPLRPYGLASLRQPDAFGAGESVATGNDAHGRVALVATETPTHAAVTSAALSQRPSATDR